ncbi:MAG: DUF4279 domain-containing protein [Phycisphaerae bacterium]
MGASIHPEEVTRILNLEPTRARDHDPFRASTSKNPARYDGLWSMTSLLQPSVSLAEHLDWLLARIEPHSHDLGALHSRDVRMDFFLGCFLGSDQCGFWLPSTLVRRVTALGASLTFDIYR